MNVIRELGRLGRTVWYLLIFYLKLSELQSKLSFYTKDDCSQWKFTCNQGLLDQHPHKIAIRCEQPKRLAKDLIDIDEVTTVSIPAKDELMSGNKTFWSCTQSTTEYYRKKQSSRMGNRQP